MSDCKSKTIVGRLLDAVNDGDVAEISRLVGLIQEGGAHAHEFNTLIKQADGFVIRALQRGVPQLAI